MALTKELCILQHVSENRYKEELSLRQGGYCSLLKDVIMLLLTMAVETFFVVQRSDLMQISFLRQCAASSFCIDRKTH